MGREACLDTEARRRRHAGHAGLLIALSILSGCKGQGEIRAAHDPAADFTRFHSFSFVPMAGLRQGSSTRFARQARRAITLELQRRGYVHEQYYPDLLINFADNIGRKVAADDYYDYRYYPAWAAYENADEIEPIHYPPGTLSVDVVDVSRMQMIWEGVAIGEINPRPSAGSDSGVPQTITKLFENFPSRPSRHGP